jgi:hypothetical protein
MRRYQRLDLVSGRTQPRLDLPFFQASTAAIVEKQRLHTVAAFSHPPCAGHLRFHIGIGNRRQRIHIREVYGELVPLLRCDASEHDPCVPGAPILV